MGVLSTCALHASFYWVEHPTNNLNLGFVEQLFLYYIEVWKISFQRTLLTNLNTLHSVYCARMFSKEIASLKELPRLKGFLSKNNYDVQNLFVFLYCWIFSFLKIQIVEEAGGMVTRMDGGKFSVFDRSILVSNGALHEKVSCHWLFCHNPVFNININ